MKILDECRQLDEAWDAKHPVRFYCHCRLRERYGY